MEPTYAAQKLLDDGDAWAALDLFDAAGLDPAARDQALDICRMYQAAFDTNEQGKAVLRDMIEVYLVNQPIAKSGDDMLDVGLRQGAADVVRRILYFIHAARRGSL